MPRGSRSQHDQPVSLFSFQDIVASITGIMLLVTLLLAMELIDRTEGPKPPPAPGEDITKLLAAVRREEERVAALQRSVDALRQKAGAMKDDKGESISEKDLEKIKKRIRALQESIDRVSGVVGKLRDQAADLKGRLAAARATVKKLTEAIAAAEQKRKEQSKKSLVRLLGGKPSGKKPYLVECSGYDILVGETQQLRGGEVSLVKRFSGDRAVREFLQWAHGLSKDGVQFVMLVRPKGINNFSPIAGTLMHSGYTLGWDVWPAGKTLFPKSGGGG